MKKAIISGVFLLVLILTMTGITPSCKHDTIGLNQFDSVCFDRDIMPVFKHACVSAACHSAQGEGPDLRTYQGIRDGVTPKSPDQSRIYQAIIATMGQPMPPGNALAESDRIKIRVWIEQGANWTHCPSEPTDPQNQEGGRK